MNSIDEERNEEKAQFLVKDDGVRSDGRVKIERGIWSYVRLALEGLLVIAVATLLLQRPSDKQNGRLLKSPVPVFPRKPLAFVPNLTLVNEDMFASQHDTLRTLHNWIPLSSDARGYVHIPNWQSFDLGEPLNVRLDRMTEGPGYMISMFHQLHCLSYLTSHFSSGCNLTQEVAHHTAHCIDYIRQGIMCAGDTSLEGKTDAGPGFGSKHECVDYEAVLAWSNGEHSAEKWRNLMPDEAVL